MEEYTHPARKCRFQVMQQIFLAQIPFLSCCREPCDNIDEKENVAVEELMEVESERLSADGQDWCRRIESTGERLGRMVASLLELLRVARRETEVAPVDLGLLIAEVYEELRLEEGGAELPAASIPEPLPSVQADRAMLHAALRHLVRNSLAFSAEPPEVELTWRAADTNEGTSRAVVLLVADRGVGVPAGDLDRIFEPFEATEDPSGHTGAGIGLALVRHVAERHGGAAWAERNPGGGTRFLLQLPT